ncbi:MAG: DUF2339 domain-containing protein [Candidatus Taylorbacteria bacterium]|nr:DUF2339 domain-containing protein [Candidatus Taylorbacteria bacterium]
MDTQDSELKNLKDSLEDLKRRVVNIESSLQKTPVPVEFRKDEPVLIKPEEKIAVPKPQESVESKITGKSFAFLGSLAILFGISFFLKYAFDNNLIGVNSRIILGVACGFAFLLLGDFLSRKDKYKQYSFYISGGGLSILYLSIFSAFNFYHLIEQSTAFASMISVTAVGALLSLRSNAKALAGLSLLGGFLSPFLVSSGTGDQVTLFTYVLILDLGFLVISYYKKWPEIYILNLVGTYLIFGTWFARFYKMELLVLTMIFLTLFFILFLISPLISSIYKIARNNKNDLVLNLLNCLAYFSAAHYILKNGGYSSDFIGTFFAFWAGFNLLSAFFIKSIDPEDYYGVYGFGGVGLVLATLVPPILLDKNWITIAWTTEALVLAWTGLRLKSREIRIFSMLVYSVAAMRLLFIDVGFFSRYTLFTPFLNERFFIFCTVAASFFASAGLYKAAGSELKEREENFSTILGLLGNFFLVLIISMDLWRNFRGVTNYQNLSLSIFWAVYSGCLMLFGIIQHSKSARLLSIFGFGVVIIKVFLYDSSALSDISRIVSFIFLGVILLVISFLFYRYKDKIKEFIMLQ